MDKKTKIIVGGMAVVGIIIIWQVMGMFGGSGASAQNGASSIQANPEVPKKVALRDQRPPMNQQNAAMQQQAMDREMELIRLQQETQAKYVAALNELQMLKVQKDIAVVNKDIAKAKSDTISEQAKVVETLMPLTGGRPAEAAETAQKKDQQPAQQQVLGEKPDYRMVSVSRLRGRWAAVLSAGGSLYRVNAGDVISYDNSEVISINKEGIVLEKDNVRRKISMTPII